MSINSAALELVVSLYKAGGRDASQCDYDIINTDCSPPHNINGFSVGSARESHAGLNFDHTTGFVVFKACLGMGNVI